MVLNLRMFIVCEQFVEMYVFLSERVLQNVQVGGPLQGCALLTEKEILIQLLSSNL